MSTATIRLILHRNVWRSHPTRHEDLVPVRRTNRELAAMVGGPTPERMSDLCGRELVLHAGSGGCGRQVLSVTRVDEEGVWGFEVSNTIRELDPAEVI